jgi:hypothetical protein
MRFFTPAVILTILVGFAAANPLEKRCSYGGQGCRNNADCCQNYSCASDRVCFFLSWLLVVRSDGIHILIDYICRLAGVRRLERARLEGDPRSVAGFHQKERIL